MNLNTLDNQAINPNKVQRAAAKDSCRCVVKLIRNVVLNRCYTFLPIIFVILRRKEGTDLHTRRTKPLRTHNNFPTGLSGSRLRENVSPARCKLSFDFLPIVDQIPATLLRETLSKPKSNQ